MDAHRIKVFDRADDDAVVVFITTTSFTPALWVRAMTSSTGC
ncbi:hypothetical protein L341_3551 [Escherichia coli CE418]|nr:hypothetical protein L341_3551 [Escherichia coli CE418]